MYYIGGKEKGIQVTEDTRLDINDHPNIDYWRYQVEKCPSTGRIHIHCLTHYKSPVRLSQAVKSFHCELEKVQSLRNALKYVWKEETRVAGPFEAGDKKYAAAVQSTCFQDVCDSLWKDPESWDQQLEANPALFARSYKNLGWLRSQAQKVRTRLVPEVYVLWGSTGVGKTRFVYEESPEVYRVPPPSTWFDGYDGSADVLFDEFNGQIGLQTMLQYLDRYPVQVPVKGGFVNFNPKRIYICSNFPPAQWYPHMCQTEYDALRRRFTRCTNVLSWEQLFPKPSPETPSVVVTDYSTVNVLGEYKKDHYCAGACESMGTCVNFFPVSRQLEFEAT